MQKYDFQAPASGASQTVNAPGRYVKYMVGNAGGSDTGLIITPGSKPGSKILLYPGQAFTLPDGVAQPNGWTIANAVGQANIAGTLVIGEGRLDDNTLSGTVNVLDGGKARTLNNSAYMATTFAGPVAAQFSRVQLWNPAGSGIRSIVESVEMMGVAAQVAGVLQGNVGQLTTLYGQGQPKLIGGSQSISQVREDTTATGNVGATIASMTVQAYGSQLIVFKEPIVVPPGYGLTLYATFTNAQMGANFEWFEEPNV